jgi:hypothetical protein
MSRESVKKIFNNKVKELNYPRCNRSVFLDNDNIKLEVEEAKILRKKHYRRLKRYEVVKIGNTQKLTESGSGENDASNIRYYCKMEELFEFFKTAHLNTGHIRIRGKTLFCF